MYIYTQYKSKVLEHTHFSNSFKQSLTLDKVSKSQLKVEMLQNAVVAVLVQGATHSVTLDPAKEPSNHYFQPSTETSLLDQC